MEERRGQDHGPGKGQAFLLTEASLCVATSSSTLIQTFPAGRGSPSRPPGRGKQEETVLKLCVGARERAPSLAKGTVEGATALPGGTSRATGDVQGRSYGWQVSSARDTDPPGTPGCGAEAPVLSQPTHPTHSVPQSHHKQPPSQTQVEQRQPQARAPAPSPRQALQKSTSPQPPKARGQYGDQTALVTRCSFFQPDRKTTEKDEHLAKSRQPVSRCPPG